MCAPRGGGRAVLPLFTGPIEQVPPAYSALMIDGERAYDLARRGEAVEMASRRHDPRLDLVDGGEDWATCAPMCPRAPISAASRATSRWRWDARACDHAAAAAAGPFTLDQAISLDRLNEIGQGAPLET
jgi:tRNA pseudouridine55 synthase